MTRFEIVTLFPELFDVTRIGILGKAQDRGQIAVECLSPREFTTDKHRTVDAAPYGGGSGMVLMPGPVIDALEALDTNRDTSTRRILMSPQGARFDQRAAERLAQLPCITIVCGRYEGFDERIRQHVDEELSLGDFVLLGGEVAALAIVEATARLCDGVLGNAESATDESHSPSGLLEYPHYTRPAEFRGEGVPDVLLSGHHAKVAAWRREQAITRTLERRPELLAAADLSPDERARVTLLLKAQSSEGGQSPEVTAADAEDVSRDTEREPSS